MVSTCLITRYFLFSLGSTDFVYFDDLLDLSNVTLSSVVLLAVMDEELPSSFLLEDDKLLFSLHGRPSSSLWQFVSLTMAASKLYSSSHSFKTVGILLQPSWDFEFKSSLF